MQVSCYIFPLNFIINHYSSQPYPNTDLRPIISQCVTDNKENDDPFLRVIKAFTNNHIIDPIVEELNEIIEGTLNSLTSRKDRLHENSRSSCVKLYIINYIIFLY